MSTVAAAPNNALQRTGHGVHVFFVLHACFRHGLSLSLEALGAFVMRAPKCKLYEPALRYRRKVVRSLHFDGDTLSIDIQDEGFAFARLVFGPPVWFRVLDERDLCEFWPAYSEPNGWLWEVEEGGWLELEASRALFNSPSLYPALREFFIADDQCISILTVHPPQIHDLGADPTPATPST